MDGWIKLHRKMLDNPIVLKDADHLAIWVYLLLNATHEDYKTLFGGKAFMLHPGQLITGRKKIAKALNINEHKVERVLKLFKIEQQIEQQPKPYGSVITILNWNDYQQFEQQDEQQMSNERATSEQPVSTKQKHKNNKNNNMSDSLEEEFDEVWKLYPRKEDKKRALKAYKQNRKNGATFDEIKAGVEAYAEHLKATGTDRRFTKMGSTFFNGECWRNRYDEAPQQSTPRYTQEQISQMIERAREEELRGMYGND